MKILDITDHLTDGRAVTGLYSSYNEELECFLLVETSDGEMFRMYPDYDHDEDDSVELLGYWFQIEKVNPERVGYLDNDGAAAAYGSPKEVKRTYDNTKDALVGAYGSCEGLDVSLGGAIDKAGDLHTVFSVNKNIESVSVTYDGNKNPHTVNRNVRHFGQDSIIDRSPVPFPLKVDTVNGVKSSGYGSILGDRAVKFLAGGRFALVLCESGDLYVADYKTRKEVDNDIISTPMMSDVADIAYGEGLNSIVILGKDGFLYGCERDVSDQQRIIAVKKKGFGNVKNINFFGMYLCMTLFDGSVLFFRSSFFRRPDTSEEVFFDEIPSTPEPVVRSVGIESYGKSAAYHYGDRYFVFSLLESGKLVMWKPALARAALGALSRHQVVVSK